MNGTRVILMPNLGQPLFGSQRGGGTIGLGMSVRVRGGVELGVGMGGMSGVVRVIGVIGLSSRVGSA